MVVKRSPEVVKLASLTFCHLFSYAGAWIKSSWGHVQREGNQLSLTYIVPQLGYWLAAMSPQHSGDFIYCKKKTTTQTLLLRCAEYSQRSYKNLLIRPTGPVFAKDISTYHTVFLLAILGGMALILLCLLCLLLYYCRCVKHFPS